MTRRRVVLFSATELGHRCCRQLLEMDRDLEVAGICCLPQTFRISYSAAPVTNVTFRSFDDLAVRHRIPVMPMTTPLTDAQYLKTLEAWRPDLGLVIGWYHVLPRRIRDVFPLGTAGIHASLLPKYRGGAPLVWAIINGESRTGVSLFYVEDRVDAGDVIAQAAFDIAEKDTIQTVYERATAASCGLLRVYVPQMLQGSAPRASQDHRAATWFPQRCPDDGLIRWKTQSAKRVYDWIRAQSRPYPGAFSYFGRQKVTCWKAQGWGLGGAAMGEPIPGKIVWPLADAPEAVGIVCADGQVVRVSEVGLADGTVMSGAEFGQDQLDRVAVEYG